MYGDDREYGADYFAARQRFLDQWDAGNDPVAVPRPQYESLMAAKEKLQLIARMQTSTHTTFADFSAAKHHAEQALAALRAAGILEGG